MQERKSASECRTFADHVAESRAWLDDANRATTVEFERLALDTALVHATLAVALKPS